MKSLLALCLGLTLATAFAADRHHRGYVDLDGFSSLADAVATVDLRLDGWLLGLAKSAAAESDEDTRWLSGIDSIRVRVFEMQELADDLEAEAGRWVAELRRSGWEDFTTVRAEEGFVYLMVIGDEQELDGITLVAMDRGHEAVLINVAGRLHPKDIARLIDDEGLIHADLDLSWTE